MKQIFLSLTRCALVGLALFHARAGSSGLTFNLGAQLKKNIFLAGLTSFALTLSALAAGIEADIPFPFRAGNRELPSGNYSFVVNDSADAVILRGGGGGDIRLPVKTRLNGPASTLDFEGTLAFDRKGEIRALSEVWIPAAGGLQVGVLEGAQAHVVVNVVNRATKDMSPQQIFAQTCQVCHGAEGRGNPAADKFFSKMLPRLNSPAIQAKTDDELRQIITRGTGAMDPVRLQSADGVRHTLPASAVDPVISYLRTLASK